MKCEICNENFDKTRSLSTHIRFKHKELTIKEYYDTYLDKGGRYCPICGKENKFNGLSKGYNKYCSTECKHSKEATNIAKEARKKTNIDKFGVENVMSLDEKREFQKKNIQKTYKENKDDIIKKIKKTTLERYGKEHYQQTDEAKERNKDKCEELYGEGIINKFQAESIKEKSKNTLLEKYDIDNISKLDMIKEKKKETSLINYGKDHYKQTKESKERDIKTNLEKYGEEYYFQTEEFKSKFDLTRKTNFFETYKLLLEKKRISLLFDKEYYINNDKDFKFKCDKCDKELVSNEYKHPQKIFCKSCSKSISNEELEVLDYVKSIYDGDIITNKRWKLNNEEKDLYNQNSFEIDIYIPEFNIGIEYDGVYWHGEYHKENNYHVNKTNFFESKDINIIHIFSTEWKNKEDIVKSIINNKLNINSKIYARKCEVMEVSVSVYKKFLIENHLQGYVASKHKLGLYYKDELVSVIGVGKSRFTEEYELLRYSIRKNLTVIGGFSKLIKNYFKLHYIDNIETYCDRRYFNGKGYKAVGFNVINNTTPGYFYVDSQEILHNRMSFQKHKLEEKLKIFDENKTEHENMLNNDYYRIYDCGNIKLNIKREDL